MKKAFNNNDSGNCKKSNSRFSKISQFPSSPSIHVIKPLKHPLPLSTKSCIMVNILQHFSIPPPLTSPLHDPTISTYITSYASSLESLSDIDALASLIEGYYEGFCDTSDYIDVCVRIYNSVSGVAGADGDENKENDAIVNTEKSTSSDASSANNDNNGSNGSSDDAIDVSMYVDMFPTIPHHHLRYMVSHCGDHGGDADAIEDMLTYVNDNRYRAGVSERIVKEEVEREGERLRKLRLEIGACAKSETASKTTTTATTTTDKVDKDIRDSILSRFEDESEYIGSARSTTGKGGNRGNNAKNMKEERRAVKKNAELLSESKIRYRDGEVRSKNGGKYVVETIGEEWDGGSRGKVKSKGKRGKGFV
jgi:hypothetical protein